MGRIYFNTDKSDHICESECPFIKHPTDPQIKMHVGSIGCFECQFNEKDIIERDPTFDDGEKNADNYVECSKVKEEIYEPIKWEHNFEPRVY
jgi:hypothetical protein